MTSKLMNHIIMKKEDKIPRVATFIDLSKAFDTISHRGLVNKLELYGIKKKEFHLVQDYLSRRSQQTSMDGVLSEPQGINSGMPPESLLRPIFFLPFMNDITEVLNHSQICLYASDT